MILDKKAAGTLFPGEYPVGKTVEIGKEPFTVIGMAEKSSAFSPSINSYEDYYMYTDTSGGASSKNNIVEYAVERIGSKKILFGTDTYSFAFQFGRIALSSLSFEDKENILWKNATELFPKAFA